MPTNDNHNICFRDLIRFEKGFKSFEVSTAVRAATLVDGPASGIHVIQVQIWLPKTLSLNLTRATFASNYEVKCII